MVDAVARVAVEVGIRAGKDDLVYRDRVSDMPLEWIGGTT
jgi:hypothetical protein